MNSFICIFCPAMIAFLIYEKRSGKKLDLIHSLATYMILVLVINCLSTVVCQKLFHISTSGMVLDESPIYGIKYVVTASAIGALLSFFGGWIVKNVKVKIVVKKEKRNNGKTKKRS